MQAAAEMSGCLEIELGFEHFDYPISLSPARIEFSRSRNMSKLIAFSRSTQKGLFVESFCVNVTSIVDEAQKSSENLLKSSF